MTLEKTLHEIAKFQFVLSEGRKGNHLLFAPEMIRTALSKDQQELSQLFREKLGEINDALNRSFEFKSFEEKRAFIGSLPPEIQHAMVFGYFQLLDGLEHESEERSVH